MSVQMGNRSGKGQFQTLCLPHAGDKQGHVGSQVLAARSTGSLGEGMGPRGMKQGAHSYRCGGLEVPGSLFNRAGTLGIVHMHSRAELNAMDANSVSR